jgi:large-conductance mechanosensitive channel
VFLVGDFVNNLLSFLLTALIVYCLVVVPVQRLMDRFKPEEPPPPRRAGAPSVSARFRALPGAAPAAPPR